MDGVDLLVMDVEGRLAGLLLAGVKAEQVAFVVSHQPAKQWNAAQTHSIARSGCDAN